MYECLYRVSQSMLRTDMDGQIDKQKDRRTDREMDRETDRYLPLCLPVCLSVWQTDRCVYCSRSMSTSLSITVVWCRCGGRLSRSVISSWNSKLRQIMNLWHFVLSSVVCHVAWMRRVSTSALSYVALTSNIRFLLQTRFCMLQVAEIRNLFLFLNAFTQHRHNTRVKVL